MLFFEVRQTLHLVDLDYQVSQRFDAYLNGIDLSLILCFLGVIP